MAAYSSFPSSANVKRFHAFPSFNGPDVRRGFLSHLHNQFASKGITMFNDKEIERGNTIGSELIQAIRESRVSIVLLSKNYASSTWCLDELVEILKCRKDQGQIVMPIFYDVDPFDVRTQRREFGKAFEKTCEGETEEKKRRWIEALAYVATIAGEHSRNWTDEAAMIEKLATDVLNKLKVEDMKEAFRDLDVDHNGFITAAELRYVMTIHGEKVTDEEVNEAIQKSDVDGDGRISYDEFVKVMAAGNGRIGYDEFVKLMMAKTDEAAMVEKFATDVSNKLNVTLSSEEEEALKEAFRIFDKDQNNFISAAELRHVMTNLGEKLNIEEVDELIRAADVDGDGQINFDEFVKVMMAKVTNEENAMVNKFATDVKLSKEKEEELKKEFRDLDVDQNGFISAAELKFVMTNHGEKLTDEEVDEIIRAVDVDGDGHINYDEFVKVMMAKVTDEEDAMVEKFATDVTLSWEETNETMEIFTTLIDFLSLFL